MDVSCNCLGIATAARVPVKRYNFLVPSVYRAEEEPVLGQPSGPGVDRSIKKLGEYLFRNPHRIPKASRRLARRLDQDLAARRLGYAQVTVQTYIALLQELGSARSHLLARELVLGGVAPPNNLFKACMAPCSSAAVVDSPEGASVVGLLLTDDSTGIRLLGTQLLRDFIAIQTSAEFLRSLEGFVPGLCTDANPRRPFSGREGAAEATLRTVRAAAWSTLLAHASLCARLAMPSAHRRAMVLTALDGLEDGQECGSAADVAASTNRLDQLFALSLGSGVGETEQSAALEFLGRQRRWVERPAIREAVLSALLRAYDPNQFPQYRLVSTLVDHATNAPGLKEDERTAVVQAATEGSASLDPGLAQVVLTQALALATRPEAGAAAPAALRLVLVPALVPRTRSRRAVLEAVADVLPGAGLEAGAWALCKQTLTAAPQVDSGAEQAASVPSALLAAWATAAAASPGPAGREAALALLLAALQGARLTAAQGAALAVALADNALLVDGMPRTMCLLCSILQLLPRASGAPLLRTLVSAQVRSREEVGTGWGRMAPRSEAAGPVVALSEPVSCAVLAACHVASDSLVLEGSLAKEGSALVAKRETWADEDKDRAEAFLVTWDPDLSGEWAQGPAPEQPMLLAAAAAAARGPGTRPRAPALSTTSQGEEEGRGEAERLRMLYKGVEIYPDELALAALPSGSFSVHRMKSLDLGRTLELERDVGVA